MRNPAEDGGAEDQPASGPSFGERADVMVDGVIDIVLIANELLQCLQDETASPFLWAEPILRRVMADADTLLKRLAN